MRVNINELYIYLEIKGFAKANLSAECKFNDHIGTEYYSH